MKARLKMVLVLISLISLLGLTACSGSTTKQTNEGNTTSTPAPSGNKSISIGITNAPVAFNPINATDNTSIYITSVLFQPLLELDEELKFVPMLADSVETTDNQTYTVKLNPKAKWTDGKPVTADDVIFTVQLATNPKVTSILASYTSLLEGTDKTGHLPEGTKDFPGMTKIDDHTLQFRTKTPIDPSQFKEKLGKNLKSLPKHILEKEDPEKLHQLPFMQHPTVVNGPFKFVTYEKNQYVELEANKDYFKGSPKLDKLFFKIMPSANLVAQLQNGEIDMNFPGIGNIGVQDFEKVKNMANITTKSGKPFNYQIMAYNTKTIPDPRVRQAIAYAIDRKMMVENLLKGEGEIMDVPYTSIHEYFNKDLKPYPYDPDKAKSLLKEAGWDSNKTLTFIVPTGNKTREQTADIIVENLKAVGIKVQIQKTDIGTAIQKGKKLEHDLLLMGLIFYLDPDVSIYFETGNKTANFSGYGNPEMDALLAKGKNEADPAKRKPIYNKIQELVVRDLPQISLYADYRLKAVSKRVIVGEPKELGMLINVHEWDVKN